MFLQQAALWVKLALAITLSLVGVQALAFKEGVTRPFFVVVKDKQLRYTASQVWWSSGRIFEPGSRFLQFAFMVDAIKTDADLVMGIWKAGRLGAPNS